MGENRDDIIQWACEMALSDSQTALKSLYMTYFGPLMRFTGMYVSSPAEAEEIVSDTFLAIWNNRKQLPGISNFDSYIYTVARHKAISYYRKQHMEQVSLDEISIDLFTSTETTPEEDIAMKSERATLNGKQRWELFKNFMPFLMMLFVANIAIVVLRDIKEDFLVNIIDVSEYSPWLFAKIDSVVTLIILVVFGLMVFVKDNLKALSILFGLIIMGMIVMSVVSFGQERFQLSPVVWLFVQSLCLYIAYLTFQTIFFDRFIACFKIHGNVGFFIVTTDFLGYTGTVLVLVLKEFCNPHIDWAVFYNQFAGYVGIFCCITFICSFVYLHQRFRKENGLVVKSNEVLELDTASQNAITMA